MRQASQEMLSTGQVAQIFEVSTATVRRWQREGQIQPHHWSPGKQAIYAREEVERLRRSYAETWTTKQVAMFFRVSVRAVDHWRRDGLLKTAEALGKWHPRIALVEIERLYNPNFTILTPRRIPRQRSLSDYPPHIQEQIKEAVEYSKQKARKRELRKLRKAQADAQGMADGRKRKS